MSLRAAFLIVFPGLFLSACSDENSQPTVLQTDSQDRSVFSCELLSDKILITFGSLRPLEMGVKRPDGKFAYLRHREFGRFVDYDQETPSLVIDISTQQGDLDSGSGKPDVQRIFDESGEYEILFSDNLETEPDNMDDLETCKIVITAI